MFIFQTILYTLITYITQKTYKKLVDINNLYVNVSQKNQYYKIQKQFIQEGKV